MLTIACTIPYVVSYNIAAYPMICVYADARLIQSLALRDAIKEYDANKWKFIGQKVGKPAKVSSNESSTWFVSPFQVTVDVYLGLFTRCAWGYG